MNTSPLPRTPPRRARRAFSALASFLMLASILTALTATAPSASAHGHCSVCGVVIPDGTPAGPAGIGNLPTPSPYTPSNTPSGGGGGTSGGGGGSGGYVPSMDWSQAGQGYFPAQPPAKIGGRAPEGDWSPYSRTFRYNNKCGGNAVWSAGGRTYRAPYIGWRWYLTGNYTPVGVGAPGPDGELEQEMRNTALSGSYSCIDPPKYYDYSLKCAVGATGNIVGPIFNSDNTATRPSRPLRNIATPFERGGRTNPDLCDSSYTFNFGRSPSAWGQYKLTAIATARRCTIRTYITVDPRTGRVPAREITGCGSPRQDGIDVAYAQLFCNAPYVEKFWNNRHSFTTDDCMGPNATWNCGPQVNNDPTLAGREGTPFEVLDDGKTRKVSWDTVTPNGDLRRITSRKAKLRFIEGSPFRVGAPTNGNTQPFFTVPKLDTDKTGWRQAATNTSQTAWEVAFLAAGEPNKAWSARPRWSFEAEFKSYAPDITWNLATNTYTYTLVPVWIRASAQCNGQPVEVDVHRARNSTG